MNETPFQVKRVSFAGNEFEIRVYKTEAGFQVMVYKDDQHAFDHGYFCDYESDKQYKKLFGKHGWERLVHCAKADISGKKIYRKFDFEKSN